MPNSDTMPNNEKRESSHFIMASTPTMREKVKSFSNCLMNILKLKRLFSCAKKDKKKHEKNTI